VSELRYWKISAPKCYCVKQGYIEKGYADSYSCLSFEQTEDKCGWVMASEAREAIEEANEKIKCLKAEVERLTKAGDALENWIAWECESPAGTADGIRDAWNAAKGKQS